MFKTKKQLKEEISRLEKENKSINQERLSLLKNRTINYEMGIDENVYSHFI